MKYLLLDVAGTILHKPDLYIKIEEVLIEYGYQVSLEKIKYNHKMLSELIKFPDRTDSDFYLKFNSEFLFSLGVVPNQEILESIFKVSSYLPWVAFSDTEVLKEISIPIGIISNFNSSLKDKLHVYFGPIFSDIFVSEEIGISKPNIQFYKNALIKLDVNPNEIIYVGDSFKLDFNPATELGIKSYVIDREGFYPNNINTIKSLFELVKLIK